MTSLPNKIFAVINGKWQVTWISGQQIGHCDLKWYEWWYLRYLQIRDFITSL
jgi:hypothetical protein